MRLLCTRALLAVVVLVATAGCGVRLATPTPTAPSPGPAELVRERTVDDCLQLAAAAAALGTSAPPAAAAPVLVDVTTQSRAQAAALGGVYTSGLPNPTASPSPSPTATSATSPAALLALLAAATSTAARDTDVVDDAGLAGLLGSIATARGELVARLAAALGVPAPATDPTAAPSPTATDGAQPTATDTARPSPATSTGPALPAASTAALVLAHDQAGYGLEVIAAQLGGTARVPTLGAAQAHRRTAEQLARAAGMAGTGADPRRAQYALPTGLADPAVAGPVVVRLEQAVAAAYDAAISAAPAGARSALLGGLREATAQARAWGAAPQPFPGRPDPVAVTPSTPPTSSAAPSSSGLTTP